MTSTHWLDHERLEWVVNGEPIELSAESTRLLLDRLRTTIPDLAAKIEEQRPERSSA